LSGIKKGVRIISIMYFFFVSGILAQGKEELLAKITMSSADGKATCAINSVMDYKNTFIGHFIVPGYGNLVLGKRGYGYDFMDYETSGTSVDFMIPNWIDNGFSIENLEGFSSGPDIKKAISFQIKPFYSNDKKNNKKAFLINFAVITPKRPAKYNAYEQNCGIKLYYKLLYPDSSGFLNVDYLSKEMPDYNFTLNISHFDRSAKTLKTSRLVYDEIRKSLDESSVTKIPFTFSGELGVYPPEELGWFKTYFTLANHDNIGFTEKNYLISDFNPDTLKLDRPVYYSNLSFPFKLYNEEKFNAYNTHKNFADIFKSSYEIILVPIKFENGELSADVILNYSKLNTGDGIQRWTPFKKRINFRHKNGIIELPHENWSAVFARGSENYQVYGYSDYERFVHEILFITAEKEFKEK